ncbi:MAG: AraC family transcriptional regulator [Bacteroidales bacterium]|nr:AraC family transcriptional regulator [Bacteroidales bacterium]
MEQKQQLQTLNYSGIFLSCFSNDNTSCVHATKDHTLLYLYSGEQIIEENRQQTVISPGECAFIRRDHRITMFKNPCGEEQYKGISLTFRRNFLREFYNKLDKNEIPKNVTSPEESLFRIEARPDITSLFQSLTPYFNSNIQPTEEIINLKLQEGIYSLLNINKNFFPVLFDFTEPWKIDILEFMNENYMYEFTMEEIASYTGRSLATFKRDFAKISDITPQKWLINKRLQIAYEKLQNKNKKVSDVYVEVGFKNLSHFYSAFKKQFGYSPRK